MRQQPDNQATGASETARLFRTPIPSAADAADELKQHKKKPIMANKNTNPRGGRNAVSGVMHSADASHARALRRQITALQASSLGAI